MVPATAAGWGRGRLKRMRSEDPVRTRSARGQVHRDTGDGPAAPESRRRSRFRGRKGSQTLLEAVSRPLLQISVVRGYLFYVECMFA